MRKRWRVPSPLTAVAEIILSATTRPARTCRASYTTPMPPRAISRTRWYSPNSRGNASTGGVDGGPGSPAPAVRARSSSHATQIPDGGKRAVQTGQLERGADMPLG